MSKIYWDEINGKVTTDSSCALIIKGRKGRDIYIETYSLANDSEKRISIAYTQRTKDNERMYYYRKQILNNHGLEYCDLGKLIKLEIPSDKYDSLIRLWKN